MMRENLDRELGKNADTVKRRWYERNRVEDLSKLSSQILKSYRRFVNALFPSVLDYQEQLRLDNCLLSELYGRPDLPPHDRQAFQWALEYNKQLE